MSCEADMASMRSIMALQFSIIAIILRRISGSCIISTKLKGLACRVSGGRYPRYFYGAVGAFVT